MGWRQCLSDASSSISRDLVVQDLFSEIPKLDLILLVSRVLVGNNFIAVRHKIFALDVLFFNFRAGRKVHLRNSTIFRCDADKAVD